MYVTDEQVDRCIRVSRFMDAQIELLEATKDLTEDDKKIILNYLASLCKEGKKCKK